jgi:hypothetical protein
MSAANGGWLDGALGKARCRRSAFHDPGRSPMRRGDARPHRRFRSQVRGRRGAHLSRLSTGARGCRACRADWPGARRSDGKLRIEWALRVCVAVATGLVADLIGSGEAQERGVMGEAPNSAARLQGIAALNPIIADGLFGRRSTRHETQHEDAAFHPAGRRTTNSNLCR